MRSGPQSFADGPGPTGLGQVEYRLARAAAIREFQRGRLGRLDICDAQPELLRLARNISRPTDVDCPICAETKLVHVWFAFGPRLPPGGRVIESPTDMRQLAGTNADASFYVVEVCTECAWNHLVRMFNAATARQRRALI